MYLVQNESKRHHFVWVEGTHGTQGQEGSGNRWIKAVNLPLESDEASALCVVLQSLRPNQLFVVSVGAPIEVIQRGWGCT